MAFALRPAPIARLLAPDSPNAPVITRHTARPTCSQLRMGADDAGAGPFTRKSLLEGVTKTAGVLGAGAFVQTGFFAGVPYFGKPDLSGKVRGV